MRKPRQRRVVNPWGLGMLLVLLALGARSEPAFDHQHAAYSALLSEHVSGGLVDYRALKQSPRALGDYLRQLAAVPEPTFQSWGTPDQLAYLINLYNAATLQLVVDHYPLTGIKEIGNWVKGPWDQPVVSLFGQQVTLNHLEHKVIRPRYREPRIHMALVCAARGCPPLKASAYVGSELERQLAEQSRAYLASPAGLRLDRPSGQLSISAIFKWYGKDFPSVATFVDTYSNHPVAGLKIRYLAYDWSLNDQAGATDE